MGLRPRTARRLALVASLVILLVGGAAAFYTIPKLQNARQLRNFERDGLAAHEEGRHHDAVVFLGRYLRAMRNKPVDPEVRLAFARSRAEWEVGDGGHLPASIATYREHLREHPDDRAAAGELLDLFIRTGAWTEARDLAVRFRPKSVETTAAEDLPIIRSEGIARGALDGSDPLVLQIEDRLLGADRPAFEDAWRAFSRAEQAGDAERATEILDGYASKSPDSVGSRFLQALYGSKDLDPAETINSFARAIQLDPETGEWTGDAALDDPELVRIVVRAFDLAGRSDLAFPVLSKAAEDPSSEFDVELVRRLYWAGEHGRVLGMARSAPPDRSLADLFGYAALIARQGGDGEAESEFVTTLRDMDHDYRAQGWQRAIESVAALADGDDVAARTKATEAIDKYALEPTFRVMLGDAHDRLGRLSDAVESWSIAEELAYPYPWVEPGEKKVAALLRAGRLTEAGEAAMSLAERTRSVRSLVLLVQTDAVLARSGLIEPARGARSLAAARAIRDELPEVERPRFGLIVASLEGALGNEESARAELSDLLESQPSPQIVAEAIAIDRAFDLGLALAMGTATLPERTEDPELALRVALNHANMPGEDVEERVDAALAMIERNAEAASPDSRPGWLRTIAVFRDAVGDESAAEAWRAAIEADPRNVSLRTEAIESNSLGYDAEFVQDNINQIVELTATQGRTLPSRLRLARAKALFGRTPTKQRRDEAISIVRSVVVAEPQSVGARTMLANMLQFPCPPTLSGADRFTPDLAGAVEQYVAAARLIPGSESVAYLFKAADLQITAGNEAQARQLLLDVLSRVQGDVASQRRVAIELGRLGDSQTAGRLLQDMFESARGVLRVELGLQLAQISIATNDRARAEAVLRDVMSAPALTAPQLVELSYKLRKIGLSDVAERVLSEAEQYGIGSRDAQMARAEAAAGSGDGDAATELLGRVIEEDPGDRDAWLALVRVLVETGRLQDAADRADQAIARFPEDEDFRYWKQIALNDPAAAVRIMTTRPETDAALKAAIERVELYDRRRESLTREQRLTELRDLAMTFPNYPAVIKFSLRERIELGEDPNSLADAATAASRRFVGDEDILRIAAEATFASGRFADSMRIASDWRGRTRGSPMQPDLYVAQALEATGDHEAAIARLEPYVEAALLNPDEGANATLLLLYGRAALRVRNEPSVRSRLEPAARQSERFRATVWMELASFHVAQSSAAADWLRSAEQMGMSQSDVALAQAWLTLAQRFPQRRGDFAMIAVTVSASAIDSQTETVARVETAARAHLTWAESLQGNEASEAFMQAEALFVRAAQLNPDNPEHLFLAAGAASRAGRSIDSERHYRDVIAHRNAGGLLLAAARNNLANLLSMGSATPQRLEEALSLANDAVAFRPMSAFLGTRGWVLLGLDRAADAAADFQEAANSDPSSVEAWAGLSVARTALGAPEEEINQALSRARENAAESGPITQELRERLASAGLRW